MNLEINNYLKFSKSISMLCYGFNEEELLATFFNKAVDLLDSITLDYEIILFKMNFLIKLRISLSSIKNLISLKFIEIITIKIKDSLLRELSLANNEYVFWQTID